ncbi:MAG: hypothetical protein H0U71_02885 [Gammaproteobacteria bacterium]|nr:hypothetical protein [Gammaproteobacteria bacterium]
MKLTSFYFELSKTNKILIVTAVMLLQFWGQYWMEVSTKKMQYYLEREVWIKKTYTLKGLRQEFSELQRELAKGWRLKEAEHPATVNANKSTLLLSAFKLTHMSVLEFTSSSVKFKVVAEGDFGDFFDFLVAINKDKIFLATNFILQKSNNQNRLSIFINLVTL